MSKVQTIRFIQRANKGSADEPLPRGVRHRYEIVRGGFSKNSREGSNAPLLVCDTEKSFLRGITRFHFDGMNVGFLSLSNREGTAWELEDVDSKRIGELTARDELKLGWLMTTAQGRIFEIYDQTNVGKDIMRSGLGSWSDAYACIEKSQEIGAIRREEHHKGSSHRRGRSGRPSFLGRLKNLMATHDWVFSHTADVTFEEELLIISGMLAVIEITVPGHRSG